MCDLCHGNYPDCPVCAQEARKRICPLCEGEGFFYLAIKVGHNEAEAVPFELYNKLPDSEAEAISTGAPMYRFSIEKCEECDGDGRIYY